MILYLQDMDNEQECLWELFKYNSYETQIYLQQENNKI